MRRLTERQERQVCSLIASSGMRYREIAERFGISESLVKAIACRNGLTKARNPWTPSEDALLRQNYGRLGAERMARTVFKDTHPNPESVCHRAGQLGLTDHSKYRRGKHARLKVIEGGAHGEQI